jgi:ABC-2 type transport system ATP-binding protein
MISLTSVSKYFNGERAVDGVSFKVGKGEVVGFLGPNGAGKTTTIRLITGYLQPTKGKIRVGGADPSKDRVAALLKIGYLPENNPLYMDMKVGEYLRFVSKLKIQDVVMPFMASIKKKSSIHDVINHITTDILNIAIVCGIKNKIDVKIEKLSRGYKQRVGLAAAMLGNPEVLIMDEPTSGLDPNQVVDIRELIRKLGEKKTVILSTHILQEVEAMCSRVIIINKGRIVWDGKTPKRKGALEGKFREVTIGKSKVKSQNSKLQVKS